MKYYSEQLHKLFDTEKDLIDEETREKENEIRKAEEKKKAEEAVTKKKKELSDEIDSIVKKQNSLIDKISETKKVYKETIGNLEGELADVVREKQRLDCEYNKLCAVNEEPRRINSIEDFFDSLYCLF